jgi:hypothetical protein
MYSGTKNLVNMGFGTSATKIKEHVDFYNKYENDNFVFRPVNGVTK